MRTVIRELQFAVLAWFVPFILSIFLFPLKRTLPPLFDSLMGVVLVANTAVLAFLYLRGTTSSYLAAGMRIGVFWMVANWAFDGLMFSHGPMKMSFGQYVMGIGTGYLMIPVITLAMGAAACAAFARSDDSGGRAKP